MCPSPVTIKGFVLGEGGGDFPANQPSKSTYMPTLHGGLSKSPLSSDLFHLVSLFLELTFS